MFPCSRKPETKLTTLVTSLLAVLRRSKAIIISKCNKSLKRFLVPLYGSQSKQFQLGKLLDAFQDVKSFDFVDAVGIYEQPNGKWHYDLLVSTDDEFQAAIWAREFHQLAYYDSETNESVTV